MSDGRTGLQRLLPQEYFLPISPRTALASKPDHKERFLWLHDLVLGSFCVHLLSFGRMSLLEYLIFHGEDMVQLYMGHAPAVGLVHHEWLRM